jgi:hypothetical protein
MYLNDRFGGKQPFGYYHSEGLLMTQSGRSDCARFLIRWHNEQGIPHQDSVNKLCAGEVANAVHEDN